MFPSFGSVRRWRRRIAAWAGPPAGVDAARQPPPSLTLGYQVLGRLGRSILAGNVYDSRELAGAFGDLGTLIPFVVAYVTINNMDPAGILLAFGLLKIWCGLFYKTPVPVQPMKAIGGAAIANAASIGSGVIWGSGIFTALFWTAMGLSGAVVWLERITTKPVVRGIMLGLGMTFGLEGLRLMSGSPLLAVVGVIGTLVLLDNKRLPAMVALLPLGVGAALVSEPMLLRELGDMSFRFRLPVSPIGQLTWSDFMLGTFLLGLPQVPLTLGNAILATRAENNALFPDRPVEVRKLALSHGFINAVSTALGGVPLCHGAGGMAGHVRFGARSGGALVMLGLLVSFTGLFLSDSATLLLRLIPNAVLGVILLFTGLELASTVRDTGSTKEDAYVMLLTAIVATFNMGIAFAAGVVLHLALRRGIVKL